MSEAYTGVTLRSKLTSEAARQFLEGEGGEIRLVAQGDGFLEWIGGKWVPKSVPDVRADVVAWLSEARSTNADGRQVRVNVTKAYVDDIMEVVGSLARVPGGKELPFWADAELSRDEAWDRLFCVAFRDQVVNVRTWEARPRTKQFVDTGLVPVDWETAREAQCPRFLECVAQWTDGDMLMADALQELYGYMLISWRRPAKIPLLYGRPRSGKSLNAAMASMLVGKAACKYSDVFSATSTWGLAGVLGVKVWWIHEIAGFHGAAGARFGSALKMIVGQDEVVTERKYLQPVSGVSRAVPVLISNKMLQVPDHAASLSSKLLVFPFTRTFLGQEDFGLQERLVEELPGIARWALEGARRLVGNGGRFTESPRMLAAKEEQAREMNLAQWFVEERFVEDQGGFLTTETVEWHWKRFLREHRIRDTRSMRELAGQICEATTWHVERHQATSGPLRKKYGFKGLGLKREFAREPSSHHEG